MGHDMQLTRVETKEVFSIWRSQMFVVHTQGYVAGSQEMFMSGMMPKSKSKVRFRKRCVRGRVRVEAQHLGPDAGLFSAPLMISNMAINSAVLEMLLPDSCVNEKLPAGHVALTVMWLPFTLGPSTSSKTGATSELTFSASSETFSKRQGSGSRKTSAEASWTQAT